MEVRVPDLGNFHDVTIIDVLVQPGDQVEVDTPLLTLETEKATMDVPSPAAGTIERLHVQKDGKLNTGDLIATLQVTAAAPAPAAKEMAPEVTAVAAPPAVAAAPATATVAPAAAGMPPPVQAKASAPSPASATSMPSFSGAHASPSVRKFARELGVDLNRVSGSGTKGRIVEADVKRYVKTTLEGSASGAGGGALPRVPVVDFAQFGPIEVQELGRIRKISGPRLQASWMNLPHVTQFEQADITDLETARQWLKLRAEQEGVKLTPLAFIVRACVKALQEFPRFNASLDASGEQLVLKRYVHIGFAADTPNGLVVPVIRDADKQDVFGIARALGALSGKARAGKLSGAEMQGGCFTISSLGGIGGTAFTPIINAPEVAILGVSRSSLQPVWQEGAFVPRLMLPLSLSYDHRVIDGAEAARFTSFLAGVLADVAGLMDAVQ
jgi:pyruvate dehydrogenase E2 component (dihydrolipoamide acetyltransferase)